MCVSACVHEREKERELKQIHFFVFISGYGGYHASYANIMVSIIYLTCIGNFVAVLHKDLLSYNFSNKESFWMLTNYVLIIHNHQSKWSYARRDTDFTI